MGVGRGLALGRYLDLVNLYRGRPPNVFRYPVTAQSLSRRLPESSSPPVVARPLARSGWLGRRGYCPYRAGSVVFQHLAEQWRPVAPVKLGGVAYGDRAEFVPGAASSEGSM
jgi:hypothetical protein